MSEVGQSILRGLKEALIFANDEDVGAVVHIPDVINVRRIRKKMDMSQASFASAFGFSVHTIQDWEQGRRVPTGSSKNFLFVIDQEPDAVKRALKMPL